MNADSMEPTELRLVLLGPLTDLGIRDPRIAVPFPISAADLRAAILDAYPAVATVAFRIALDRRLLRDEEEVTGGSEVALLPPFAGG